MTQGEIKTGGQILSEKLSFTLNSCWEKVEPEERADINRFAESYKTFLDSGRTVHQLIEQCAAVLKQNDFTEFETLCKKRETVKPGTKIYHTIKDRSLVCAVMGKKPLGEGVNIIAAHVDSPHIELKTNPLYEDSGLGFLDTQYYGSIKYYQWAAIPLAMSGTVIGKDGVKRHIRLGNEAGDPVFTITDLLPHLAYDQMKKNATDFIDGEGLDILAGSEPYRDEAVSEKVKLNILDILHETYGVTEKTFANAEISFTPAFNARDVGFDRAMIGACGHDDKSCAYAALWALLGFAESGAVPEKTVVCFLIDKEEVNGYSPYLQLFKNCIQSLCEITKEQHVDVSRVLSKSAMISADVNAAYDPNYADVYDKRTSSFLGKGIAISKSGTGNYADMDFCQKAQDIFDRHGVQWQYGGWGKVGKGGASTIARDFAGLGMDALDCGVPVLSMHSPFEIISKIDLWTAYKAYAAFFKEA
jgi:aspartyl aminopeptidase